MPNIDDKILDLARSVLADHETYFAPKILLGDWDDNGQMRATIAAIKAGMALQASQMAGT